MFVRSEVVEHRIDHGRGKRQHVSPRGRVSSRLPHPQNDDNANSNAKRILIAMVSLIFLVSITLMMLQPNFVVLFCIIAFMAGGTLVLIIARHLMNIGVWKVRR